MPSLSREDIVTDPAAYEQRRPGDRERMIDLRARRRLRLGDQLVVEFENAETLTYQVQEMVYAERMSDNAEVGAEIEAYSRLLPDAHSLGATLFVELEQLTTVRSDLQRLAGLQHALAIDVGGRRVPGAELPGPDEEGPSPATYSVHFLRFAFGDAARDAFRDPDIDAALVVDHPAYAEDVPIAGDTRRQLLADLALAD
jgi:hypothetical protein